MRIHKVSMKGFGAYPEMEVVNFDKFADDGIFVITGKTGAGKTTILDAITFALFGTVPRYGSSIATDERVRSDYLAGTDKPTEVALEFSQGDRRYRVSRTPTWLPTGKKTEKQTWAQIEEIHADGRSTVLETRKIREVNAKINEIVRLNAAQFTQVVLLAQGEFQKFLIADSNERRDLLRKLFDTGRFSDYSKDLDGRAGALRSQLALTGASLKTNVTNLAAESDVLAPVGLEVSGSATVLAWAQPLLDAKQQALTEATAASSAAKAQLDAAAVALATVEKIAERQKRRNTALADQTRLIAEKESVEADIERLGSARRADIAWPAALATSRAQNALKAARETHEGALVAFSEVAPDESTEPDALKPFAGGLTGEIAKLIEVIDREEALPSLDRKATDAEAKAVAAAETVSDLEKEEKERKAELDAADKKMAKLEPVAKGLAQAERILGVVAPRLEAAEEADALTEQLAETTKSMKLAISAAREAVDALEAQVDKAKAKQKTVASKAEALVGTAKVLPAAQKELDALEAQLTAAGIAGKLTVELDKAKAERSAKSTAAEEAAEVRTAVLRRQRAEYAGELAAELQECEPCIVCGSISHPSPAVRSDDHVTEDNITAAESAVTKAEADYHEASSKVAEVQALLNVQQEASKGETVAALSKAVIDATKVRDSAAEASGEVEALSTERNELDEAIDQLLGDLSDAKESLSNVTSDARAAHADLEARIKVAQKKVAGESTEALATAVAVATKARDHAAEAADELERLNTEQKELFAAIETVASALVTAREAVGTAKAAANEASSELAKETDAVEKARGQHSTVAARTKMMEGILSVTYVLIDASSALDHKIADEEEARRLLSVALDEQSFETSRDCQVARLSKNEQTELSVRIDKHAADTATITSILAEPGLSDLPDEPVDVTAPKAAYDTADEAHDALLDRRGQAQKSHSTVKRLVDEIKKDLSSSGNTQKEYDLVDGLATVVRGQGANEKKMTLETFALAADLEEIVMQANVRLGGMTASRFKLEYSDEVTKGKGQSGLVLDVVDAYNDETRPPESLSGGEKFQASLALALGLADVVTSRNGGVRLDTLFIDEGFGALDPDTLNDVMDAIDDLRGGGRTVGLISHVEQVKDRVPNHIEVEVTEDGWSRLR